jgi:antitoxin HigA-1
MILTMLNAASHARQMDAPGLRLHPLKGKPEGRWAVDVDENYRVTSNLRRDTPLRWIMATITDKRVRMHSPAHPGEILRELYLAPLGIAITAAAKALGVTRKHVSAIVNERTPVTPDMALRLAVAFTTDPELWVNLQAQYDLWAVSKKARPKVKTLVTKKAA